MTCQQVVDVASRDPSINHHVSRYGPFWALLRTEIQQGHEGHIHMGPSSTQHDIPYYVSSFEAFYLFIYFKMHTKN